MGLLKNTGKKAKALVYPGVDDWEPGLNKNIKKTFEKKVMMTMIYFQQQSTQRLIDKH